MRVTTVTATLRYSAEAKGAWRSIEVGAEATLTSSDENWETAQAQLYQKLGHQLKTIWGNGTDKASTEEQPQATPPKPEHWCEAHQSEHKARTGPHWEFYSHQINGTRQWCNESKTAA